MSTRRKLLKSIALAPLALGGVSALAGTTTAMPAADDPDYWRKIRDQFLLAKDRVFFNPGTVGAMPFCCCTCPGGKAQAVDFFLGGYRAVRYTPRHRTPARAAAGCRFHPGRILPPIGVPRQQGSLSFADRLPLLTVCRFRAAHAEQRNSEV